MMFWLQALTFFFSFSVRFSFFWCVRFTLTGVWGKATIYRRRSLRSCWGRLWAPRSCPHQRRGCWGKTSSLGRSTAPECLGRRPLPALCSGWWRGSRVSEPEAEGQERWRMSLWTVIPNNVLRQSRLWFCTLLQSIFEGTISKDLGLLSVALEIIYLDKSQLVQSKMTILAILHFRNPTLYVLPPRKMVLKYWPVFSLQLVSQCLFYRLSNFN